MIKLLVGIPGCGKTTFANRYARENRCAVVSRDKLRYDMFGKYTLTKLQEKEVKLARNNNVRRFHENGLDVIVDETNLNTFDYFYQTYGKDNVELIWMDDSFNFDLCMKRNIERDRSVPYKVVEDMYYKFISLHNKTFMGVDNLINVDGHPAVIIDIDGTVANMETVRKPYEFDKVINDHRNYPYFSVIEQYAKLFQQNEGYVIFLSGRDDICEEDTRKWLDASGFSRYSLFMRSTDDNRSDYIVKRELYEKHVYPYYNVDIVFDDREKVVKMWKSIGLNVMQVHKPMKSAHF